MKLPSTLTGPAVLTAAQLAVWPGVPLLWGDRPDPRRVAFGIAATVLFAVAFAWRRTAPVTALAGGAVPLALGELTATADGLVVLSVAQCVTLFHVAARRPLGMALAAAAALALTQTAVDAGLHGFGVYAGLTPLGDGAVNLVVVALGHGRQRWGLGRREAAERLAHAGQERRRSAVAERHRLARELHDVSAHHLTAVVVSATAAQRLSARRPELSGEALDFSARTGRAVLADLQQLVTVLRDAEPPGSLAGRIERLADGFAALGQPVTVAADLDPAAPPSPAAAEAAYGIAREALTNAVRHAPGASTAVRLAHRGGALELTVGNGPARSPGVAALGSGRGLTGAAERAASAGGRLEAGPAGDGGWLVRAVLPPGAPAARAAAAPGGWLGAAVPVACVLFPILGGALDEASQPPGQRLGPAAAALAALLLLAHALPLFWRRRAPLAAGAAVLLTTPLWVPLATSAAMPATALVFSLVADCVAVYAAAAHGRARFAWVVLPLAAVLGGLLAAVAFLGEGLTGPEAVFLTGLSFLLYTAVVGWLAASLWAVAFIVRGRREWVLHREHSAVEQEAARAAAAAQAERARIAAGLRAAVLRDAARVIAAAEQRRLDDVVDAARAALAGMRNLLNDLDADGVEAAPRQVELAGAP